jgi:dsRNA-specific ribonuclease
MYLVENKYTNSPVGKIGKEKADRFYEALIGAIYIQHGFKAARHHIIKIMKHDTEFVQEFKEYFKDIR